MITVALFTITPSENKGHGICHEHHIIQNFTLSQIMFFFCYDNNVKVGNDQEMAQLEGNSHTKNRSLMTLWAYDCEYF